MTDFAGSTLDGAGLSEFVNTANFPQAPGFYADAIEPPGQVVPNGGDEGDVLALKSADDGTSQIIDPSDKTQPGKLNYDGFDVGSEDRTALGDPFFGEIIVVPSSISLGNVLSSQQRTIEIYNASKDTGQLWQNFVNNAGAGLSIPNLPSLPTTLEAQDGVSLILQVDSDGPPVINGTLDFVFALYTIAVPITGQRVVVFPFAPETPLREELQFLTDVMTSIDGSEQRVKLRKNPRQVFRFQMRRDGDDRRFLDSLLFDWQANIFGVGMWHEAGLTSAAVSSGSSTVSVVTTDYADYRVGSLAFIISGTDRRVSDALEIQSIASNSITFTSGLNFDFPAGSLIMPMRTCYAQQEISGNRATLNLGTKEIVFRVIDNDSLLADTSAWNSFNGKVLLDDPNRIRREINDRLLRRLYQQDSDTGSFSQISRWGRGKRLTTKGFVTTSRQQLWELRQLLHALGGRLTSFYQPTFYDELQLSVALTLGSNNATIENVGFSQFIQDRKGFIRFTFTDGTSVTKTVLSSSEVDADTETIVFTDTWPQDYTIDEVDRIDYVETMRSDSDTITITHVNGAGYAGVEMPVTEVFDE